MANFLGLLAHVAKSIGAQETPMRSKSVHQHAWHNSANEWAEWVESCYMAHFKGEHVRSKGYSVIFTDFAQKNARNKI